MLNTIEVVVQYMLSMALTKTDVYSSSDIKFV